MTNEIVPVSDRERIAMMVEAVGQMDVTDAESNLAASEVLRDVKGLRERLAARVTDLRRPILAQANAISEEAKPYLDDLMAAEQHLKGVAGRWQKEQRDIARAEEEAREEALQRAIAEGRHQEAQEHLEAALQPVERPWRAPGTSLRETWHAEVTDIQTYVSWAANRMNRRSNPRPWILPNQQLLDAEARTIKGKSPIPGVKFVSTTGLAASGR